MTGEEYTAEYCTASDVSDALDLPDPSDPNGTLEFSNVSHPNLRYVYKMIRSNEDIIDKRLRRTWRENKVTNQLLTINDYWHDINGWRADYYAEGGSYVQLRKDIRQWDPTLGDKLEIRTRQNQWLDISDTVNNGQSPDSLTDAQKDSWGFWFDYPFGKLYIRVRLYQQRYNALRITYRYGSEDAVPEAISRLCTLMTASQIIVMQPFNIKVGMGGDISGIKDMLLKSWQDEMNAIWTSYQRSGSVHSLLR